MTRKTKREELLEVATWLGQQAGMRFHPGAFGRGLVTLDIVGSDTEPGVDNESEHSVIAVISTRGKDRAGDIVEPGGVDLSAFRKNPVVLWAHSYGSPPIARSLWERVEDDRITAKARFHLKTQLSREAHELYRDADMKAWSIGFIPTEFEEIAKGEDEADPFKSYHITKWELLEYSTVPVPCNAEAVSNALREGRIAAPVLVKSLEAWLETRKPKDADKIECTKCGEAFLPGPKQCPKCGDEIKRPRIKIEDLGEDDIAAAKAALREGGALVASDFAEAMKRMRAGEEPEDIKAELEESDLRAELAQMRADIDSLLGGPDSEDEEPPIMLALADVKARLERIEALIDEKNELAQANLDSDTGPLDGLGTGLEPTGDESATAGAAPESAGSNADVLEISAVDLKAHLAEIERGVIRRMKGELD